MTSEEHRVALGGPRRSIYSMYSPLRSAFMKFTAAMGFLLSYSGSIYLPAFQVLSQ